MSPNGSSLVLFDFSFAFNNIYNQTKPPPIKHKDIKDKFVIHASPNPIIKNGYVNLDPNTFATIAKPTTQTTPEPINNPL